MGLNKIVGSESYLNLNLIMSLSSKFGTMLNSNKTVKSAMGAESVFINYLNRSLQDEIEFKKIRFGEKLDDGSYTRHKVDLEYDKLSNYVIVEHTIQVYLEAVNEIFFLSQEIENKIKRINQKRFILEGWKSGEDKYFWMEKFLFLSNLKFDSNSKEKLSVNTNQGIITLPIEKESIAKIRKASIKKGNGFAGNSDEKVSRSDFKVSNAIDGNVDTWFEYERLDSGPVFLQIKVDLNSLEFINKVRIGGYFQGEEEVEIVNIAFNDDESRKTIKELVSRKVENSFFKMSRSRPVWEASFVPVKCRYAIISLSSNSFQRLESFRKRFSIGIRNIEFLKVEYGEAGSCYSKEIDLPDYLNAYKAEIDNTEEASRFCEIKLECKFDEGWEESKELALVPVDADKFEWKLQLKRNAEAFKDFNDFEEEEEIHYENFSKTFSKGKGRRKIQLKENKKKNKCFAIEKGFGYKSEKQWMTLSNIDNRKFLNSSDLVTSEEEYKKILLPINLIDHSIENEEVSIRVNNIEYSQVESLEDVKVQDKVFAIGEDSESVYLSGSLPAKAKVKWKIAPEEVSVLEGKDYYYFYFSSNFNADVDSIRLRVLDNQKRVKKERLEGDRKTFRLKASHIYSDTLKVSLSNGTELNRVEYVSDLDSSSYYFHDEERILKVKGNDEESHYTVSYEYESEKILSGEMLELWFSEDELLGVKIEKHKIKPKTKTEDLSKERKNISFRGRGSNVISTDRNNQDRYYLGRKGIIKNSIKILSLDDVEEVEYIDGKSEFLKLFLIENEETTEYAGSSLNPLIKFKLAAREKWHSEGKLFFEENDYFTKETLNPGQVGEWRVYEDGTVEVYAPDGIPEGIKYSYYYTEGEKLYNKFSYNSKSGFLYLSERRDSELKIEYKLFECAAEYEIGKRIKLEDAGSNALQINSDMLYNRVSEVRIFNKKESKEKNLLSFERYYSPIIYSVGFRFR